MESLTTEDRVTSMFILENGKESNQLPHLQIAALVAQLKSLGHTPVTAQRMPVAAAQKEEATDDWMSDDQGDGQSDGQSDDEESPWKSLGAFPRLTKSDAYMAAKTRSMALNGEPLVLRPNDKVGKSVTLQFMTQTIGAPLSSIRVAWKANNQAGSEFDGKFTKLPKICLVPDASVTRSFIQPTLISCVPHTDRSMMDSRNF
jgi:hypothetical protein